MNTLLKQWIKQATRLTQSGDLKGATAAIQAALGRRADQARAPGAAPHTAGHGAGEVVDVEAREIPPAANEAPPRGGSAAPPAGDQPQAVPDGAPNPEPTQAPSADPGAPPQAEPGPGRFIGGRHDGPAGGRAYKLYIPPGPEAPGRALVVMLHGCTQNPDDFAAGTGMNEAARSQGFFVLYPEQTQNANASRCWNWFKPDHQRRGGGEPALLAGMTREVMALHRIDPRRVYVAGLSAGGAMAAILGDAYPELYAAIGVHSGLPAGAAHDVASAFAAMKGGAQGLGAHPFAQPLAGRAPGWSPMGSQGPAGVGPVADEPSAAGHRAPPTIVFHGDQDGTVHPGNGLKVVQARAGGMAPQASEHGPAGGATGGPVPGVGHPQTRHPHTRHPHTRHIYRDAHGRVVAEHWTVHGAGHAWSGGSAQGSYTDPLGPPATLEMLRFFSEASSCADDAAQRGPG